MMLDIFIYDVNITLAIVTIFYLFPIFIFLYKMLNLKQTLKSTMLILTAFAGFVYGMTFSIGEDTYLADDTGIWFLFLTIWLVIIGLFPIVL